MVRTLRKLGFLFLIGASSALYGQYSIGGGVSTLFEFGNKTPYVGMHINVEFPRNNDVTFYGRVSYLFNQKRVLNSGLVSGIGVDLNVDPYYITIPYEQMIQNNHLIVDGGTRYYIINGFDEGFSLYGGTNIALIVNSVKSGERLGDYDASKYIVDQVATDINRGTLLRVAIGFTGGAKYTIPRIGSFYIDFNPYLSILALPSNGNIPSTAYKPVLFNFNIGYRKEIF